jgi:SAC3 domain-containing protein 1
MLVKEYSRPAAGKVIRPQDLRTLETLVKTTNYLVNEVYNRYDVEFIQIYEFLFDRFRAIRQDFIIQRCSESDAIQILCIILRFYILADYKLCFYKNYDEFMNFQHLSEVYHIIIF